MKSEQRELMMTHVRAAENIISGGVSCDAAHALASHIRELLAENERLQRDMRQMVSGFRSHLGDLIRRIGPARRPEDIKSALEEIHNAYNSWGDASIERELLAALEAMMEGNVWEEPGAQFGVQMPARWATTRMPTIEAINRARAAIAKAKGTV
jgi:hypothetical protein